MKIAYYHVFHAHMKHTKLHYHYICEKLKNEEVEHVHVPSQNQLVNVTIKPLGRLKFEKFKDDFGVFSISETKQKEKMT
ncbi:unnamed protein product [Sphagnum jensenii]|jgi:hypothetical protein|uniref:Uncharacterized protein n=1 Tax=Sphagnum jensenii TaxID=128206 RepID=A0ABP1BTT0_9BRYO